MKHVDVPRLKPFLLGFGSPILARPLQPSVLEHLLKCRACLDEVQEMADTFDPTPRLALYPETDCLGDSELCGCGPQPVARMDHLRTCLWCALAVHDHLALPHAAPSVEEGREQIARMNSLRALRAAAFQAKPQAVVGAKILTHEEPN